MSRTERRIVTKRNITILALLAFIVLSLGTYFTIQMVNAQTIKEQLELGDRYYQEQKYEEAIIAYETVLEIDEENVEARIGLAKSYQALAKVEKAREVLTAGIQVVPDEPSFYLSLSELQLSEDNVGGAIETLDQGLASTKSEKIQSELNKIDSSLSLISDRDEVQVEKTAQLKLVYIKQAQGEESQPEGTNTSKADNDSSVTEDSSEEQHQEEEQADTSGENEEDVEQADSSTEKTEEDAESETTEQEDANTSQVTEVLVEGKWTLKPGKAAELSEEQGTTNVLTAKEAGEELVVATVGSIEKQATITIKDHVLENFEIVASVNKNTVGEDIELRAIGKDANGDDMEVSPEWVISEGVGSLSAGEGQTNTFVSDEPGDSTIIARVDDKEFSISLEVIEKTFKLYKSVSGQGSITSSSRGNEFKDGQNVSLKAIAAEGWEFVGWDGNLSGGSASASVVMNSDKAVKAIFKQKPKFYTLQVKSEGNGSVTKSSQANPLKEGTVVTLEAVADKGWTFDRWKGHASGTNDRTQVKMDGSKDIVAVFTKSPEPKQEKEAEPKPVVQKPKEVEPEPKPSAEPKPEPVVTYYKLALNVTGQGTVERSPSQEKYTKDSNVSLKAIPAEGWLFHTWEGDLSGTNSQANVTMNNNKDIRAVFVQAGNMSGTVKNALNGQPVSGAALTLRKGENAQTGTSVQTITSAENGQYAFSGLVPGTYTLETAKEGYTTKHSVIEVKAGENTGKVESIMPDSEPTNFRVVLTWGTEPNDLDAHLTGPTADGDGRFHISYGNKTYAEDGTTYAKLDTDVTNGGGPETVTTFKHVDGVYRYYVYNFSGSPSITTSEAKVELYQEGVLTKVFNVPTTGDGRYWNVFEIDNGQLKVINQLSSSGMQ